MAYFDGVKTSQEARERLFRIVDGKGKEEIGLIREEYHRIVSPIVKKELMESDGWMTNDGIGSEGNR